MNCQDKTYFLKGYGALSLHNIREERKYASVENKGSVWPKHGRATQFWFVYPNKLTIHTKGVPGQSMVNCRLTFQVRKYRNQVLGKCLNLQNIPHNFYACGYDL